MLTETAPAVTHASTTAASCSGESDMPGSTGAIRTPQGMPAAFRRATASTRRSGGGVPGSLARHTSSSSVPIERLQRTRPARAASASRSVSRRIMGDLVRIENWFPAAVSSAIRPRVSR